MLPGLFGTHFEFAFGVRTVRHPFQAHSIELGIYRITLLLLQSEDGQPGPSLVGCCIFFWGIVMPFIKLGVLLSYKLGLLNSPRAIVVVQRLSKWAMVDVFVPMLWIALCNRPSVLTKQKVQFTANYVLFAIHVLLNMCGVLLIKLPKDLSVLPKESSDKKHWIHIVMLCTCVVFAFLAAIPMKIVNVTTKEDLSFTDSVSGIISNLWAQGYILMSGTVLLFGVIFPAIDYPLTAAGWLGLQVNNSARKFFEAFAMFDVLMVALLCTSVSVIVLEGFLKMHVLEGGIVLLAVTLGWYIATLEFHSPSGSQATLMPRRHSVTSGGVPDIPRGRSARF